MGDKLSSPPGDGRKSKHKQLIIIGVIAIIVACAIGFGVGFGVGLPRSKEGGEKNNKTTTAPLPPGQWNVWQPQVGSQWQIVLLDAINLPTEAKNTTPPEAQIWDIDLFLNPKETISTLHRLGKKVICYFSAGSYEPGRPDSNQFKEDDMGKGLDGWPGERWLNIKSDNVRRIMENRIKLAKEKECDGVDPDNVDAYDNDNGLNLTPEDSINFLSFLSTTTHQLNMSIGLKNAAAILPSVLTVMEWSVNEQCVQMEECEKYSTMITHGKPVFHIEYPSQIQGNYKLLSSLCSDEGPAKGAANFSTVIKNYNLDGWVRYCDGVTATTPEDS